MKNTISFIKRFNVEYFFSNPDDGKLFYAVIALFVILLVSTIITTYLLRQRAKQEMPYKKFARNYLWVNLALELVGFLYIFFRYENLNLLSYRFWLYLLLIILLAEHLYFIYVYKNQLQEELKDFHSKSRKEKWLKKKRK